MKAVAENAAAVARVPEIKTKFYAVDANLVGNDWKENPSGQSYTSRLGESGRPDLQDRLDNLYTPQIEEIIREGLSRERSSSPERPSPRQEVSPTKKQLPEYATGGLVGETGPALVHQGELILTADLTKAVREFATAIAVVPKLLIKAIEPPKPRLEGSSRPGAWNEDWDPRPARGSTFPKATETPAQASPGGYRALSIFRFANRKCAPRG
jgi:hypothetical protein